MEVKLKAELKWYLLCLNHEILENIPLSQNTYISVLSKNILELIHYQQCNKSKFQAWII
jgi:hypothetical protein